MSVEKSNRVYIFDTTLRDGAQTEGVEFTPETKARVAQWLDHLGVAYVEGGWPGASPDDTTFFAKPPELKKARFTAFGMTHGKGLSPDKDKGFLAVVGSSAPVSCLVGKSSSVHVTTALKTTFEDNLNMIRSSVSYAVALGKEVVFDAEHFFDGYKANPEYALACLRAAHEGGAKWLVLCDTNGGTLPHEVTDIVSAAVKSLPKANFGVHCHNDTECAVANTLLAVMAGCRMVQGTLNGLGERCGNANLMSLLPTLAFKLGFNIGIAKRKLKGLKKLAEDFNELIGRDNNKHAPYVGENAFAHKGGLHASAVLRDPTLYEHIPPELVGNNRKILVSDQSGLSNVRMKLTELKIEFDEKDPHLKELLESVKRRKSRGYNYERATASFAVLALRKLKRLPRLFSVHDFDAHVHGFTDAKDYFISKGATANVSIRVGDSEVSKEAHGKGPVHALDKAMRKALNGKYPELEHVRLVDYKVGIFNADKATGATTRVSLVVEDTKTGLRWNTMGISEDIVAASLEALVDAYNFRLTIGNGHKPAPVRQKTHKKIKQAATMHNE